MAGEGKEEGREGTELGKGGLSQCLGRINANVAYSAPSVWNDQPLAVISSSLGHIQISP